MRYLIIMVIFISSCSSAISDKDFVQKFYDKAKRHESELSTFFNVSFTPRGYKDNRPFILRIEIALDEKETITLPGLTKGMTDEEIKALPFFENVDTYSKKTGLIDSMAYSTVKDYLISITELAYKLEAYKVRSTPRLGRFIIFKLSTYDEVIYIPDLSDVKHDYWKKFFDTGQKLGDNWYYRSTKSN